MADEKIRLGGMALANGVLVHGPTAWACAIRTPEGELKVESATKSFRAAEVGQPFLRGAARLAEVMLLLPQVRRTLPEARLPFERPRVLATMVGSAVAARLVKTSRLRPLAQDPPLRVGPGGLLGVPRCRSSWCLSSSVWGAAS